MIKTLETFSRLRDITLYRTVSKLKAESKNNNLGYVWFILEPLIGTAVLYFAFSALMGRNGSEMVMFILIGMMVWQWMESAVMLGIGGIREKLGVLNTVKIPKYLFPLVNVLASTWKFLCMYLVVIAFCNAFGYFASVAYVALPIILFAQLIFIMGLTLPLAIIVTYMPDLTNLVSSLFRLLFFLSGIFYTVEIVPDRIKPYFFWNPIAGLMEAHREVLLHGRFPNWSFSLIPFLVGTLLIVVGLAMTRAVDLKILKQVSN
jgi:lipopolysaccharide transport system permease protein